MNLEALRLELIDALRHPEELGVGYCPRCKNLVETGDIEIEPWVEKLARLFEDRVIELVER